MIFEEALAEMRKGKRITHPSFEPDEYFVACKMQLLPDFTNKEKTSELLISIAKMKGDYLHSDMGAGSIDRLSKDWDKQSCKHGNFAQLNLFLIMSDDWEII